MVQPKIFIILLHFRDIDVIQECLASLNGVSCKNFKVIIVHNGRPDAELEKRVASFPGLLSEVIHTGENSGFAKGNNIGIRRALQQGAEYVLLLNDDTTVDPGFWDLLVAKAVKDPSAGMLGPRILYFSEREKIWFSGAKFDSENCEFFFPGSDLTEAEYGHKDPEEADFITGCALLVKKEVIEKIGLLDERFFLYWEDSDWGLRARAAGFKCLVVPTSKIWHKVSVSSGGTDSPFKAYHKTFSHLLFCSIHTPAAKKKLIYGFLKDIAWLLFKSRGEKRFRKAWAYALAMFDHYTREKARVRPWLL